MTAKHKASRRGVMMTLGAGTFLMASILFSGVGSAQSSDCPAGARGGPGGVGGRSVAGNGGLAFAVGGFGTTGNVDASGGQPGSARGGAGGRGGSGTLPICNQNTNGVTPAAEQPAPVQAAARPAAAPAAPAAAPAYGDGGTGGGRGGGPRGTSGGGGGTGGGGLARTGAQTNVELGLAGFAFVLGGMFLFFGTPAKQLVLRMVGLSPAANSAADQDWEVLGWSPPFRR